MNYLDDLQQYQFSSVEVPFTGQYTSQLVEIQAPGSAARETWTEISSLFLMDEDTKGYTVTRSTEGITIGFGNGLIFSASRRVDLQFLNQDLYSCLSNNDMYLI